MSVNLERPVAPYAPLANVLAVVKRLHDRGIPEPVTPDSLTVLSIPPGNAPRTLQALRFLGIVAEDGLLLPAAERLRRASSDEYPETLAEIIREAYAPIFKVVDPATDTEVRVADAFRQYDPAAQRSRMVTLFLGLCAEAGIATDRPKRKATPGRPKRDAARRPTPVSSGRFYGGGEGIAVTKPATPDSLLFGVQEADLALLSDDEFNDLWGALGVVARARARARVPKPAPPTLFEQMFRSPKPSESDGPSEE
jgi:hypothetical protein